jgi:hypothetical protein
MLGMAGPDFMKHVCSSNFKSVGDDHLVLPKSEEIGVRAMIEFIYTWEYPVSSPPFTLHIKAAAVADKYDLPNLWAYARARFEERIGDHREIEDVLAASHIAYGIEGPIAEFRAMIIKHVVEFEHSDSEFDQVFEAKPAVRCRHRACTEKVVQ